MTNNRTGEIGDAGQIPVCTLGVPLPETEALPSYLALAERFGPDQVYLLDSAGGPVSDCRYRFIGFGELLSLTVTRDDVRIAGVPELLETVCARVEPLLDTSGETWRLADPDDLWQLLRELRSCFAVTGSATEFRFGFLAYFGYDTARYVEELPYLIEQDRGQPDVRMVLYRGFLVSDTTREGAELRLHESPAWPSVDPTELTALLTDASRTHRVPTDGRLPEYTVDSDVDESSYLDIVDKCLKHIAVGDIYQVQIGQELTIRSTVDPVTVYRRLLQRNPSPYMYLAPFGDQTVIGASPELFVRVEDRQVTMRPIAGTAPRGPDDDARARRLRTDPKERAEHTMLVDLCRNDIGRICERDTLDVPDKLVIERYSHVLHLVSTVTGRAQPSRDAYDIIAALFPAGTMTGAPKIRAMEIIEEMEHSRRGLYAGALGLIDVDGYVNLALCIRTLIHHDGAYRTRASAGIVADSVPGREWRETLAKLAAGYWAVTGEEPQ
jgi:anthranilate/para-aminobenzoate synthase component I